MKDGKDHLKLTGLIKGGTASFDEKPGATWLNFGAEFPGFKEEKLKRAFDRNVKRAESKELGARGDQHVTLLKFWHALD